MTTPTMLERAAWASFRDHRRDARYYAGSARDLKYRTNVGPMEEQAADYYAMAREQLHRIRAIRSGVNRVMAGTLRGAW